MHLPLVQSVDARQLVPAAPFSQCTSKGLKLLQVPLQQNGGVPTIQGAENCMHEGWALQVPFRHLPVPLQVVSLGFGLHLPFLQTLPCVVLWHLPFLHVWHSVHDGLHAPPAVASSGGARPSRPSDPASAAARARRREPVCVKERVSLSKRALSKLWTSEVA
jgi:hypothetical protein